MTDIVESGQSRPKFIIPELVMPSDEELRASSLRWFDRIGPTLIDRWPSDLMALSIPTEFVRFPLEIMEPLFEPKGDEPDRTVAEFALELDAKIGWKRRFVRLNSRSPKDATWPFEAPATISGKEAMSMFGGSERILDDLCYFRRIPEIPAYVCLRDWVWGFRTDCEYRCFVKDGELIAVTHYDYTKPWSGPQDGGKAIRHAIDKWFVERVRPALPVDTVVFDLHLQGGTFMLIEINPYGLSDPCHFRSYERVENASGFIEFADPATLSPSECGGGQ
jgi:hypothetical protein